MNLTLRSLISFSTLLLAVSFSTVHAQADVTFMAVDESDTIPMVYITGGMNAWAKDSMYDDGTHGDMVADDHVWSITYSGLVAGTYQWGLASDVNNWLISGSTLSCTVGDDNSVTGITSYTLTYSDLMVDITFTITDISKSLTDVQFSGWGNGWVYEPMYDDGTHGDATANDNTWSLTLPHRADRDYEWGAAEGGTQWLIPGSSPVVIVDSLGNVSGVTDFKYGGASVTLIAIDESDTISQLYATGTMNSWASDELFDDGTNGDETAGDHIWSRTYSNLPAAEYQWGLSADFNNWLISGPTPVFTVDTLFNVTGTTAYVLSYSDILVDVVLTVVDNTDELVDVQFTGWVNGWVYEPMFDDGTHGDETADDHTWSLTVSHRADRDYDWGAAEAGTTWLVSGSNPNVQIDSLGNVSGDVSYVYGSTAINEFSDQNLNIFPNPAQSVLNIESGNPINHVEISNIMGQQVMHFTSSNNNGELLRLNINSLANGVYLISVYDVRGTCEVAKFIKKQ